MGRLRFIVLATVAGATLGGCALPGVRDAFATKYSADDRGKGRFGIAVEEEGNNLYRILATGNEYSSGQAISDMALLRAAQIAVEQDRSHFQIVSSRDLSFRDSTTYAAVPERRDYFQTNVGGTIVRGENVIPGSPAYTSYGPTLPSRGLVVHLWDASTVEAAVKQTGETTSQLKVYPAKAVYAELAATVPGKVPPLIEVYRNRAETLAPRYARVRGDKTTEEENLRRALIRTYLDVGFAARDSGDTVGMKEAFDQAFRLDDGKLRKWLETQ